MLQYVHHSHSDIHRRKKRWPKILGWILLVLALAAFLVWYLTPREWLSHIVSDKGSNEIGRSFVIDGPIHIHWDWREPYIEAHDVRLANMKGALEANMVDIEAIRFHIKIWKLLEGQLNIPDIDLVKPKIYLEKFDAETKNWDFPTLSSANTASKAALPTKRANFPIIGRLNIEQGQLTYRDKTVGLDTTLNIDSINGSSTDQFHLSGDGILHGQKFIMKADGGSLEMLRESDKDYPLNVHIQMGPTDIKVDGTFHDPVNMQGIDTQISIRGDNLADLFYITGAPLPPSPTYSFSAHLQEQDDIWNVKDIKGRIGQSDINGDITYDTTGKRSYMKGAVVSNLLRMEDLGGFIGAKTDKPAPPSDKLLPDMQLNLTRLRSADVDVDFKATNINQPGWPIEDMNTHFQLKDGILHIDPLSFGVANGKVSGSLVLDGQKDLPTMDTDILLQSLSLKPFFAGSQFESLSQGRFGGRVKIKGNGKSFAEVLGDSNGQITMMMTGGTISKLIVDAAGLDIAKAAPELLDKDQKTDIRCAVTDFTDKNGVLDSNIFVFDTTASNIAGTAHIDLKNETMDAKIEGHPKNVTISGQIPITISGPLRKPVIGVGAKELAERGGAAAALSAVLTPLAGIIPFIDVDLGKDASCGDLINAATSHSGVSQEKMTQPKDDKPH